MQSGRRSEIVSPRSLRKPREGAQGRATEPGRGVKDPLSKKFFKGKIAALESQKPSPRKTPAKCQAQEKPNKIKGFCASGPVAIACGAVLVPKKKIKNFYLWA